MCFIQEKSELVKLVIQFMGHDFNIEINSCLSDIYGTCLKSLYLKKTNSFSIMYLFKFDIKSLKSLLF